MSVKIEDLTGSTIVSESGCKYKLIKQGGYGAQGVVYEDASEKYMVKLYYPSGSKTIDADILDRIRFIKNIQMPKNFVSVIDIITVPYIGYVMEKVVGHRSLNSYLVPDRKRPFHVWYNSGLGLFERLLVGQVIAKAFGELEKSNLSYCDISGNNILIKATEKGVSVKIIDIDNIYIAGRGKSAILGTPRYIAPEIINRQKNPDILSDNYSLAVILFELLRAGHPYISDEIFNGTPEDEENALLGNAEYVTDVNSANMLPADVVFTYKLKKLFERCFIDGKNNRIARPSATEFEYALLEASNKLIKCPNCGVWYYPKKSGRMFKSCPWCDSESRPTAMLNFYDVLFNGSSYKTASATGTVKTGKLINTYILKERNKNFIKSIYILRYDDPQKGKRSVENYLTIAKLEKDTERYKKGFYIYNEFSKPGIVVKRYKTRVFEKVDNKKAVLLNSGDEIYFEIDNGAVAIKCGGLNYSFIRMARFVEVKE